MKIITTFMHLLERIHTESFSGSDKRNVTHWNKSSAIALLVAAFCLLLLHYSKFYSTFYASLELLFSMTQSDVADSLRQLKKWAYFPLLPEAWWFFWHLVAFFVIPILVIKYVLKDSIKRYGLGVGRLNQHKRWYVLLTAPILFFIVMVSFREDFVNHYPFYKLAHRSWIDFFAWEIFYLSQFFFVEFFFRGFILQACRPAFGVNAIFIMIVPYMMIHLSKPWLEAAGAIFFGLFLGVLALHTRSIWGGVLVHVSIALSMDVAALLQTKGLPEQFFP